MQIRTALLPGELASGNEMIWHSVSTCWLPVGRGPGGGLLVLLSQHVIRHHVLQFPADLASSPTRAGISGNHAYTSGTPSHSQGFTVIFGTWHFVGIQESCVERHPTSAKNSPRQYLGDVPALSESLRTGRPLSPLSRSPKGGLCRTTRLTGSGSS